MDRRNLGCYIRTGYGVRYTATLAVYTLCACMLTPDGAFCSHPYFYSISSVSSPFISTISVPHKVQGKYKILLLVLWHSIGPGESKKPLPALVEKKPILRLITRQGAVREENETMRVFLMEGFFFSLSFFL